MHMEINKVTMCLTIHTRLSSLSMLHSSAGSEDEQDLRSSHINSAVTWHTTSHKTSCISVNDDTQGRDEGLDIFWTTWRPFRNKDLIGTWRVGPRWRCRQLQKKVKKNNKIIPKDMCRHLCPRISLPLWNLISRQMDALENGFHVVYIHLGHYHRFCGDVNRFNITFPRT